MFTGLRLIEAQQGRQPVVVAFAVLLDAPIGPVAGNWPNYGKLDDNRHHCHLKKGRPTYVAVWWEVRQEKQTIEVAYVGTHEKAPY